MHDIRSIWTPDDLDIRELTDTDLEATRTYSSRLYDTSGEVQALIEVYRQHSNLDTDSAVVDRALRIEVAAWLDSAGPTRHRDDYDVAYTIPPEGWVAEHSSLLGVSELSIDDTVEPHVNYTAPEVLDEIAQDAIDSGAYEGETDIVRAGLKRMVSVE